MADNNYKNLLWKMETKDFLYLLGLYIGDGYTACKRNSKRKMSKKESILFRDELGKFKKIEGPKKDVRYESNNIYFALPVGDNARPRLIRILKRYKIDYKTDPIWIRFSSYPLARMFKTCGKNVYEKHIPEWTQKFDSSLLKFLFDGIIDSDGHRKKINPEMMSLRTVSKRLAEDFSVLCFKIGKVAKIGEVPPRKCLFIKEKRIINSKKSYNINVAAKPDRKIYSSNIFEEDYQGGVWCLEMEGNHNFLVERKGYIGFSGNSSEMFGKVQEIPQTEKTPFYPRSPYGCAKVYAYNITRNYRESYGMFACSGILHNHESERRGKQFVTRKITDAVARIKFGLQDVLELGNLNAKRDWGHAKDFIVAMYLMLQQPKPVDYLIATGETHTVREFAEEAFKVAGMDIEWEGTELNEVGKYNGKVVVKVDPNFYRPADVELLLGDPSKAKKELGWVLTTKFKDLVKTMVEYDLKQVKNELRLKDD